MADMLNDGNIKVSYVPSIADPAAPTVTELQAGTSLECLITADGLNPSSDEDTVSIPKLCETTNSQAPGRTTYGFDLTFVRQEDEVDDVAWTTLLRGTEGFLVIRYGVPHDTAWAADQKVQVYPGRCGERRPQQPEANGATTFMSTWYVAGQPELDAVVSGS
ncbi:MAG: hypothetical protein IRZ03_08460 [Acidobacterium ailaaui]|nr:hypothetical protein [Pseudacidobacterium ailaaui]